MEDLYSLANISGENKWYKLITTGYPPSPRVGHLCIYLPKHINKEDKIHLIGGATVDKTLNDHYTLTLRDLTWHLEENDGFCDRYEHCGLQSSNNIYVFGGANVDGNKNDVQVYSIENKKWENVEVDSPTGRTQHSAAVLSNNTLVVLGGGAKNTEPVQDRQVHIFHPDTKTWKSSLPEGEGPLPRQGHVAIALPSQRVLVHGGMLGKTFYDDLHELDLKEMKWRKLSPGGSCPSQRAGHGAVMVGDNSVYLFGGLGPEGNLGDFFCLNTDTWCWTKLDIPRPSSRLDFGMCLVTMNAPARQDGDQDSTPEDQNLIFLHGGINLDMGEVWEDCFVYVCGQ